jgi:Domain of unknown function (DUF4476)
LATKGEINMKKLSTLSIAFLMVSVTAFAGNATLSVTAISNKNIYVLINGSQQRVNNNNTLFLTDLNEGNYRIEVYQLMRGVRNNPFSRNQLLYNGNVYIRNRMHTDIVINRFGRAMVDQRNNNGNSNNRDDYDDDNNGWNNGNGGWNNGNGGWNNGNGAWGNGRAMSTTAFEQLKQTLCNEAFENNRLNLAKQVVASNWFTTSQVRDLMKQFNFENNKLDIAKHAYNFTVDRNNYYLLTNEFSFSTTKQALMRHIQGG